LGVAFSLALAGTSFARHAITAAGWAANGINASRHNLSTSGSHFNMRDATADLRNGDGTINVAAITSAIRGNVLNGSSEMCAICHTPHFAQKSAGPIWNRAIANSTITQYGTTIAKNEDGGTNMFSTLACLSCHDGVTTFNSLINKPGKGLGGPANGSTGGQPANWKFNDGGDAYGTADTQKITNTRLRIGGNGTGNASGGTDLTDDHPIGVLYRGQGDSGASASLRARTVSISAVNMNIETEDGAYMDALAKTAGNPNANLWAVKGFITDTATIQDLLRSGSGNGSGNYVQCSSCHDLHYKNQTNPEAWFVSTYGVTDGNHEADAIDGLFLRRVGGNSDSGLCRTCHDKQ
jgi:hypothetical protein